MNFKENISIAIYSIRTHLMRSLLTMLGVIIGVFSVIAIITIGNGGRDYIVGMVRDLGQSVVGIYVDTSVADSSQYITEEDVAKIKKLENVQYASQRLTLVGSAQANNKTSMAIVFAGNADFHYTISIEVVHGRFYTEDEYKSAAKVCLIAKASAEDIFGRTNVVGKFVDFSYNGQTQRLRVIGVCDYSLGGESGSLSDLIGGSATAGSGNMSLMIMPSTLTEMMTGIAGYDSMFIVSDDERDLDAAGTAAVNLLYTHHGNRASGAYSYNKLATYIDILDKVISILTTFIAGVSGISLMVGGIGVMNIMLVSVTERTREIGIRKALGAKTSSIMFQFLTESVILCLIGGFIGLVMGIASAQAVGIIMKIPIELKLSTVVIAVGFSSAIGTFFGIYPAKRAAKMLPIDALRRD